MTSNWWEGERKSVRKELLRITSMLATSSLSNEASGPTARTLGRCWSFRVCLWMTQFCSFCTRRAETGLLAYLKDIDLIWESLLGLFSLMGWSSKMAASKHYEKFFSGVNCRMCYGIKVGDALCTGWWLSSEGCHVLKRNKLKMSSSKDSKLFVLNLKKSKFKEEGYNFISQLGWPFIKVLVKTNANCPNWTSRFLFNCLV